MVSRLSIHVMFTIEYHTQINWSGTTSSSVGDWIPLKFCLTCLSNSCGPKLVHLTAEYRNSHRSSAVLILWSTLLPKAMTISCSWELAFIKDSTNERSLREMQACSSQWLNRLLTVNIRGTLVKLSQLCNVGVQVISEIQVGIRIYQQISRTVICCTNHLLNPLFHTKHGKPQG